MDFMTICSGSVKVLDDNKDKILLGTGLAAGLGTVILASRATLKAKDIIDEHKSTVNAIRYLDELHEIDESETKKEVLMTYTKTCASVAKVYAPSVVLGATATACLIGEHCVMQKKVNNLEKTVASLSAAYIAVDKAFKAYRKRVVDKYGKEEDEKLRYDIHEETVECTDEKGKKVKKSKKYIGEIDMDATSKIFDGTRGSGYGLCIWDDPYHHNIDWDATIRQLLLVEAYLNDKLRREKIVFLNDAWKEASCDITKAGQVLRWKLDDDDPDNTRNKIRLGISDPINKRLINGEEVECLILQANVDGPLDDGDTEISDK